MAILETEVWVIINTKTRKYYEGLGYEIPLKKGYKGKMVYSGDEIKIKVEHLTPSAKAIVTKICDDCGLEIPKQKFSTVINKRKNGKDRCASCGNIEGAKNRKENVKYKNSLACFSELNNKKLLTEFSKLNKKSPNNISYATHDKFLWNCSKCKSYYDMEVCERTVGSCGCSYCSGHRVNETNCLWNTRPDIASLLVDKDVGFKFTKSSRFEFEFQCPDCGFKNNKSIHNVTYQGFSCSKCSDGISYPEKFMMNVLDQLKIEYEHDSSFDWSEAKRYDFYIPSLNIIETHGEQHYKETNRGKRTLKEEQENDRIKKELALKNGIKEYIIIDCRYSEMNYIKKNIINSELSKLFDLNSIDWLNCHAFACTSLVKVVSEMWKSGIRNIEELANNLKIHKATVKRYLKIASDLDWCDFKYRPFKRQIVQLTIGNELVKFWDSIKDASSAYRVHHSTIGKACSANDAIRCGYRWMYKEDYDKLVSNT